MGLHLSAYETAREVAMMMSDPYGEARPLKFWQVVRWLAFCAFIAAVFWRAVP